MILKTIRFFCKPIVLFVVLAILLIYLIANKEDFVRPQKQLKLAEQDLQELTEMDAEAAKIMAEIEDKKQQRAMRTAALSASGDRKRRSTLSDMAEEMAKIDGLPYRARLAKLSLEDLDLGNKEERQKFFDAHGMMCQSLVIADGYEASDEYCTLLEQAREMPNVWPLVRDDPMALIIWAETDTLKLVRFYRENRDWLADPLAALDLSDKDGWNLKKALHRFSKYEDVLKEVVKEADLGVYGLAIMLTHGGLVSKCTSSYGLPPDEVISIIAMNGDIFTTDEQDAQWIQEKASWLAQIEKAHPTVWYAATRSPFALRLYRDAPHVADSILEKYGHEEVAALIYQHFTESDEVAAAAQALDMFGDLAIYVFAKYEDEVFMDRLGDYLTNPKIGPRAIPFIVRFNNEAFEKMDSDPGWVDRYFKPDGSPREDNLLWIQYVPGGAALHVARNWARGYPNEWSELGWAAVDVADAALVVASFGTSKAVTTTAKTTAKSAKKAAQTAKAGERGRSLSKWKKGIQTFRRPGVSRRTPRLASVAQKVTRGTGKVSKPIWGTIRITKAASSGAYRTARKAFRT